MLSEESILDEEVLTIFNEMEVHNSPLKISFSWRRLFTVHERLTTSFLPALRRRNARYKNPQLFVHATLFRCNKCFCCGTSWSRKVKNGNLQRNNVARQVGGLCISYCIFVSCISYISLLPGLSCQNYTCDFPSECYCHLARILPCLSHCRFLYSNEIYPWKSERKRSKVPIHM